jgi:hypothetical protein
MRLALMLWMVAMLAAPLGAQERRSPAFDVASVKPNKSGETRARFSVPLRAWPSPTHHSATSSARPIRRAIFRSSVFPGGDGSDVNRVRSRLQLDHQTRAGAERRHRRRPEGTGTVHAVVIGARAGGRRAAN